MNKGALKRSQFTPALNDHVDEHYNITKNIMRKKGIDHHSNTRLRDYINYIFTLDSSEEGEVVVKSLLRKPTVVSGKISF
jgi:hypothetical protein